MSSGRWVRLGCGILVGLALALAPSDAAAQGGNAGRDRVRISLNQKALTFPAPRYTDFDAGYVEAPSMVISVLPRANQPGPWELRILADTPDMGGYGKPIADILWRRSGSTTWHPLTNTPAVVLQSTGRQDVTLFFRLRLDYAQDLPNTYSADITFSAQTL